MLSAVSEQVARLCIFFFLPNLIGKVEPEMGINTNHTCNSCVAKVERWKHTVLLEVKCQSVPAGENWITINVPWGLRISQGNCM